MAQVNLDRDAHNVSFGLDGKVIIRDLADIPGGRALDVTGWTEEVIKAGHIIKRIKSTDEYAPLGVSSGSYVSLEQGEEFAGVLKGTILAAKAAAAIMTVGEVNAACSPYPVTDTIVAGLPQIKFLYK